MADNNAAMYYLPQLEALYPDLYPEAASAATGPRLDTVIS